MSVAKRDLEDNRKVTTHRLIEMKQRGEKISMLTAYDYSMAQLIDQAGMDVILVGDSASNVMAGNVTTLPITLDQMIYHGKSVMPWWWWTCLLARIKETQKKRWLRLSV